MAHRTASTTRWAAHALVLLTSLLGGLATVQAADPPAPKTTADPTVPIEELKLMLRPLTQEELVVEADGWLGLVKSKVAEISTAEIEVSRTNRAARESASGGEQAADGGAAQQKQHELERLVKLREARTALIDRLDTVLGALERKGGDASAYRTYVKAVAGITADVDVADMSRLWTTVSGWLTSKEGGVRWGWNILYFLVTIVISWIVSRIAGNAMARAMSLAKNVTDLVRNLATSVVRRVVFFAGVLVAITFLEVQIGPLLAIVGAAGFVIAFALQGTLSNVASGLMILAQRPFDVGNAVNVAGVSGIVRSMNLVSTEIHTFDNQRVVVPNNSIWGNVITNITGLPTRRVDMTFGIGYGDDTDKAASILESLLREHPLVLDDPAPTVKVHELGDSSVNLICRPWTKTSDYWAVYWDFMRQVKQRFDAEGITIPFPQRDVHVYQEAGAGGLS
jgi:small conductance mechanosensitive channel